MKTEQIKQLTVAELRKLASQRKVKNILSFKRDALILEIEKTFKEPEEQISTSTVEQEVVQVRKPAVEREEIDRIKELDRSKSEKFRMLYTRGMRVCDIVTEFGAHYSFVYGAIQRMNQD